MVELVWIELLKELRVFGIPLGHLQRGAELFRNDSYRKASLEGGILLSTQGIGIFIVMSHTGEIDKDRCSQSGPKRDRTADLYTASVALSQLSYGPKNFTTQLPNGNALISG